jgi:hypothetical protein
MGKWYIKFLCIRRNMELTSPAGLQNNITHNVLGAKINNLVYARHFTMAIPASCSTVLITSFCSFPLRFSTGALKRSNLERLQPAISSILGTRLPPFWRGCLSGCVHDVCFHILSPPTVVIVVGNGRAPSATSSRPSPHIRPHRQGPPHPRCTTACLS